MQRSTQKSIEISLDNKVLSIDNPAISYEDIRFFLRTIYFRIIKNTYPWQKRQSLEGDHGLEESPIK